MISNIWRIWLYSFCAVVGHEAARNTLSCRRCRFSDMDATENRVRAFFMHFDPMDLRRNLLMNPLPKWWTAEAMAEHERLAEKWRQYFADLDMVGIGLA